MDIALIIGIGICFCLMLMGMVFDGSRINFGNLKLYFDISSILIVVGGTIGATLAGVSLKEAFSIFGVIMDTLKPRKIDWYGTVDLFVKFAGEARRDGVLVLQKRIEEQDDPLIKSGLQIIVDGADSEILFMVIGTKIQMQKDSDKFGCKIFVKMGTLAPAFGMMGTVIGLIQVLANLADPSKLGAGIAVAFITTFYGIILAHIFFNPFAAKIERNNDEKASYYEMILTGLQSIHEGDNPFMVEEKLKAFCPKEDKKKAKDQTANEENPEGANYESEISAQTA